MNELIKNFALDTENDIKNLELARYYHSIGHTASGISHYLRCAELTQDNLLAYECLIFIYLAFIEQKDRDFTAHHILKQAITILPDRPEAYLLICEFFLQRNQYYDCYLLCSIALKLCNFNSDKLKFYNKENIYSYLLYIKASSGIHWENIQESKNIFKELYTNYFPHFDKHLQDIIIGHVKDTTDSVFQKQYKEACDKQSDINQHLPILYSLAQECYSITEFGVKEGDSTKAFLASSAKKLRSYDLLINENINQLFNLAKIEHRDAEYKEANVLQIDIEQTDMLFIDTWHQYDQLKNELNKHANKVNKYIVLHDTHTFGINGENSTSGCGGVVLTEYLDNPIGLLPALIEFMIENPEWKFKYHTIKNNGLTVIQRMSQ